MFQNALYYPHILLPQGDWLRRAILFWETINPIVPEGVNIAEGHVTRLLQQAGCLRFIRPEEFLEWEEGIGFSADFVSFLETPGFLSLVGPKKKVSNTYLVHQSKFASAAMEFLVSKGLAIRGRGPWMELPKEIGSLYMAWLAAAIAKKLSFHPITEENRYYEKFLLSQAVPQGGNAPPVFTSYESIILDKVLPVPRGDVPVERLLKFRQDHRRELLAFTQWVAKAADELKKIPDEQKVKERLSLFQVGLGEHKLAIEERFRENGLETKAAILEVLVDFKVTDSAPAVVIGSVLGGSWGGPIGTVVGAGIAKLAVAGVKIYSRYLKGKISQHSILREYPTAYVFSVGKAF